LDTDLLLISEKFIKRLKGKLSIFVYFIFYMLLNFLSLLNFTFDSYLNS